MIPMWLERELEKVWKAHQAGQNLQVTTQNDWGTPYYLSSNEGVIYIRPLSMAKCDEHDKHPQEKQ